MTPEIEAVQQQLEEAKTAIADARECVQELVSMSRNAQGTQREMLDGLKALDDLIQSTMKRVTTLESRCDVMRGVNLNLNGRLNEVEKLIPQFADMDRAFDKLLSRLERKS